MAERGSTESTPSAGETSDFTPPQVMLPKGGGAIRGMGEKFQANAVTGTGSLTVPIALSPSRSDFAPELSLGYDSGNGNGEFGLGWRLFLPSITRKTDKGLPRYDDGEESDVFILSGAEDLVPVVRTTGEEWRGEPVERDGFAIKRYRPRVEGLFALIERWTRIDTGETHWRSISKDNILTLYGHGADSRVSDPDYPAHVFKWLISASYDSVGNAIRYEYVAEDDGSVDLSLPSERRRVRTANRYLKRVLYGNRTPIDRRSPDVEHAAWMFEVVFDFGDEGCRLSSAGRERDAFFHVPDTPPAPAWPVRADPFSTYRSGFEVRTYRLCQRALLFHHFPDELHTPRCLVRSTDFVYREKTSGSLLTRAIEAGYTRQEDRRYLRRTLPPLELSYTPSPLEDDSPERFELSEADARNLPAGIDGDNYRWVDLDGEGIAGVLVDGAAGWYYKRNAGAGRFEAPELISRKPSTALLHGANQQLLDVAGDGNLDLVDLSADRAGYYERTPNEVSVPSRNGEGWTRFRTFASMPVLDWSDPNLRFVDLTGDGIADVLVTEEVALRWHPSLLTRGFGQAVRIPAPHDERDGPAVVFADAEQTIYLADMSGDGLSDIVRIRNGEVCYWPNLGYGRFGRKIGMDDSPWFDTTDLFDQTRIRLADTDGSGTTDILYLTDDGVHVYLNQSGNAWSERRILRGVPAADVKSISVTDFLGHGTACLVWSSPLSTDAMRPLRYVDLMRGQKPHLLTRVSNNLGADTAVEYASSTEFYLADRAAGTPWVTRLPFPVHVVKRVETFDYVSRNRFVTTYSYHHGYYDGVEREFRGFGRVDQTDTSRFDAASDHTFPAAANEDATWRVPPAMTRTWYHTGVFLGADRVSRHMAHEYYREPHAGRGALLDDTILPVAPTPEDAREACRALKGALLRQETYALDDTEESPRPYKVSESNYTIRLLQPRGENRHAVFFRHDRESLTFNDERKLYEHAGSRRPDPRASHTVVLAVDDYGNVRQSVGIAYGRRFPDRSMLLTDADRVIQSRMLATLKDNRYTNAVQERNSYRIPALAESRMYELTAIRDASESDAMNPLGFADIARQVAAASDGRHDLPFEEPDDQRAARTHTSGPFRRLFQRTRTLYRSDRLDRLLPFGHLQSLALPGENYRLALTPDLLAKVYRRAPGTSPGEQLLPEPAATLRAAGGYVDLDHDGNWWAPSGRIFFSPDAGDDPMIEREYARRHFFLARRFRDPFGNTTHVAYDAHDLVPVETRDAVGSVVRARLDYRVLRPRHVTDANGNRSEVAFDALGMVTATAIRGKVGEDVGDSLAGIVPDLPGGVLLEHFRHPLQDPLSALGAATTRILYDLFAFVRTRGDAQPQPGATYSILRETHESDLAPGERTKVQHAFSYSDGLGREIQQKLQAEAGAVPGHAATVSPRWVGRGWTIFDNKGNPVRQYEPFFSATHEFEFAATTGVSPTLLYDPLGRVVATLRANHTYEKVVFDPWRTTSWDTNDTVLGNPRTDRDVGSLLRQIPAADYLPTWYQERENGALGRAEENAARKAARHAGTPAVACADSLGRTFLAVAHNRFGCADNDVEEFYRTRTALDIAGNALSVSDALGRVIMAYDYDLIGARIHQECPDSGERWTVNDAIGKPILAFDSRGHRSRYEYDALRRPVALFIRTDDGPERRAERTEYGESRPDAAAHNLRGKVFRHFDEAGVVVNIAFDFKGNLLRTARRVLSDYRDEVDWSAEPALDADTFESETTYDALSRPVTLTAPDRSVVRPDYNEANLIERVSVSLTGAADDFRPYVTNIDYNAKAQRELIELANGARTTSAYDPLTFRLVHVQTTRARDGARLQDLGYAYDPAGNITSIEDAAQQAVYFQNQVVPAGNRYVYDAVYRLIYVEGREHRGLGYGAERNHDDFPRAPQPLPADGRAMRNYREAYRYDAVGNIVEIVHSADAGNWTRKYAYDDITRSNHLSATSIGDFEDRYAYDPDGNMTRMRHLPSMTWDSRDHLSSTRTQVVNDQQADTTYYTYDSTGRRVRKVTDAASGARRADRLYLGGFERYREYVNDAVTLERTTLHLMASERRIALVETRAEETTTRYQLDDHLGSSCVEIDETAAILSYEEYYAFGSTSYRAGPSIAEVSLKRYRFTGMENDTETGFNYHSARYYAPWLGRWVASDPVGIKDDVNTYAYVSNRPTTRVDPSGLGFWGHVWGGLKTVGGALETAAGAGLVVAGAATSEIGIGIPIMAAGAFVTAHGVDTVQAGARQTWTGNQTDTVTSGLLQDAGMSKEHANMADATIGIVGTLGAGALTRAPGVVGAVADSSEGLVHLTTAEANTAIGASKTLGTGGTIYAGPASLADASGAGITLRTGLTAGQATDAVVIPAAATSSFRVPAVIGPISAWQRLSGTVYTAGAGTIDLTTGVFARSGPAVNQLAIYGLDATVTTTTRMLPALPGQDGSSGASSFLDQPAPDSVFALNPTDTANSTPPFLLSMTGDSSASSALPGIDLTPLEIERQECIQPTPFVFR